MSITNYDSHTALHFPEIDISSISLDQVCAYLSENITNEVVLKWNNVDYTKVSPDWTSHHILRDGTSLTHRTDGPAMICNTTSTLMWYVNNELHRVTGPARIMKGSYEEWFCNGTLRREDHKSARTTYENGKIFSVQAYTRGIPGEVVYL